MRSCGAMEKLHPPFPLWIPFPIPISAVADDGRWDVEVEEEVGLVEEVEEEDGVGEVERAAF